MQSNINNENVFKKSSTILSVDKAFELMGNNLKYQKKATIIISIMWIFYSFLTMGMPLLFQEPTFRCKFSEINEQLQECNSQQACKAFSYEIDQKTINSSIVGYFQLYCDRQYFIGIAGSVFFLGSATSGLIFPYLSNKRGWTQALYISLILTLTEIFARSFAWNISTFIIMIFFCGLGYGGFETVSQIYISEISGENFRNYSAVSLGCAWSVAQILYGFLTIFLLNWRLQCTLLIFVPLYLIYLFSKQKQVLLESPRFLVQRNRFLEARAMLYLIGFRNKQPPLVFKLEGEEESEANTNGLIQREFISEREQSSNYGFSDFFRNSPLRSLTFSLIFMWSFRNVIYFGQSFSLSSLGAEMHLNFVLIAASETVAILMTGPIKRKIPPVAALFWLSIVITLFCVSLMFLNIPDDCHLDQQACIQKRLSVLLSIGIRFGITVFTGILRDYTIERFPKFLSNQGYGICFAVSQIVTIFIPLLVIYFQSLLLNPLSFFGFMGIGATILCRSLKKTEGQSKYQIIESLMETPLIELANNKNR